MTQKDIEQLEQIDEMWMRNLFECSRNVPKDLLYLELGLIPISYIIKGRKQMFLHHILQQKEDSLLHRFFMAQMKSPSHNDWVSSVLEDMIQLEINLELEDIKYMKKEKYRTFVNDKVQQKAFEFLVERKSSRNSDRAKGKLLEYNELILSEYLSSSENDLSIVERKWLFKCRIEDIDLNTNRKWNNEESNCTKCINTLMNQKHLLECNYLMGKNKIITYIPTYEELFRGELEEQIYISRLLKENIDRMKAQIPM